MIIGFHRYFPATWHSHQLDASNLATYTFSGLNFKAGRVVILLRAQAGTGVSLSGVTIKGVAATSDIDGSFNSNNPTHIMSAVVTEGTGDIVVTLTGGTGNRCAVGVWEVGQRSFVTGVSDSSANPCVLDRNTQRGDVAVAGAYLFNATSYAGSASLPNERFDGVLEGSNEHAVYDNLFCDGGTPEAFGITQSGTTGNPLGIIGIYR